MLRLCFLLLLFIFYNKVFAQFESGSRFQGVNQVRGKIFEYDTSTFDFSKMEYKLKTDTTFLFLKNVMNLDTNNLLTGYGYSFIRCSFSNLFENFPYINYHIIFDSSSFNNNKSYLNAGYEDNFYIGEFGSLQMSNIKLNSNLKINLSPLQFFTKEQYKINNSFGNDISIYNLKSNSNDFKIIVGRDLHRNILFNEVQCRQISFLSQFEENISISRIDFMNIKAEKIIFAGLNIPDPIQLSSANTKSIRFIDCFLDNEFYFNSFDLKNDSEVEFVDCTFGENFKPSKINYNIKFVNCQFQKPISLVTHPRAYTEYLRLGLHGVDVSKILFDYSQAFWLEFKDNESYFVKEQLYQKLLDKFKSEHKTDSYKRINLEYNNLIINESPDYFERVITKFSRFWWLYGFNRVAGIEKSIYLVILWYLFNLFFRKAMKNTYEIQNLHYYEYQKWHSISRKIYGFFKNLSLSLFYTLFIMFSIRVDSSKLHFHSIFFTSAYFLQYISGIGILLFVINYILTK